MPFIDSSVLWDHKLVRVLAWSYPSSQTLHGESVFFLSLVCCFALIFTPLIDPPAQKRNDKHSDGNTNAYASFCACRQPFRRTVIHGYLGATRTRWYAR